MTREAKHPVRTLEKTLELLDVLEERNGGQIYELAEDIDLGESAIHNHLSTLREYGYVVKRGDEYRLSLKFLQLGGHTQNQDDLYRAAGPVVNDLTRQIEERVFIAVEEHEVGVFLSVQTNRPRSGGEEIYSGQRFELHDEPVGMAILSALPADRVKRIFEVREVDPNTRQSLRSDLKEIQSQGYVAGSSPRQDARCVAVPLSTDEGRVLGALGVEAPASQHGDAWFESELRSTVADSAEKIEMNIKSMFLRDSWIESSTVRD